VSGRGRRLEKLHDAVAGTEQSVLVLRVHRLHLTRGGGWGEERADKELRKAVQRLLVWHKTGGHVVGNVHRGSRRGRSVRGKRIRGGCYICGRWPYVLPITGSKTTGLRDRTLGLALPILAAVLATITEW